MQQKGAWKVEPSLVIVLVVTFFILWFAENLVISDSLPLLPLREIDDYAFQISLRKIHDAMATGSFHAFWTAKDYGYGWIFWATHAFVLFPFYLAGLDRPLIVAARDVSTICIAFGVVVTWLAGRLYVSEPRARFASVLLLLTSPIIAFAAMRFHTHGMLFLFSSLSVYFLLKSKDANSRNLKAAAFFAGLTAATKLVGLFLLPGLTALALARFLRPGVGYREIRKPVTVSILIFGFTFLLGWFPPLLFAPFFRQDVGDFAGVVKYYLSRSATNSGSARNEDIAYLWSTGFGEAIFPLYIWVCAAGAVVWAFLRRDRRDWANFTLLLGCIVPLLYLSLRSKAGSIETSTYFIPVLPVFLLAFARGFSTSQRWGWGAIAICLIACYTNRSAIETFNLRYFDKLKSPDYREKLLAYDQLKPIIADLEGPGPLKLLVDYKLVIPASTVDPHFAIEFAFDELTTHQHDFDLIVFAKETLFTKPNPDIKDLTPQGLAQLNESRSLFEQLNLEGRYAGQAYAKVLDTNLAVAYRKRP